MSVPELEKVQSALGPYHAKIESVVRGAWMEWVALQRHLPQPASKRASANMVWDFMVQKAREAFDGDSSVRVIELHQTCHFVFRESVLLRFKKADEQGLSRNYPTQRALSFYEREPDLFDAPIPVEVVYVLNRLATALSSVQVVARNKASILWAYDLQTTTGDNVVELPRPSRAASSVARLKKQKVERETEEKG